MLSPLLCGAFFFLFSFANILYSGMTHKTRPIFSLQFHPEAKGGPMDSAFLFDKYIQNVKVFKDNEKVYRDNRPTQLMLDILNRERVGVEPSPLASAA